MLKPVKGLLTLTLITLTLVGCSPVQAPAVNRYTLDLGGNLAVTKGKTLPGTLLVTEPQNGPGYDTNKMAYMKSSDTIDYFVKNQWVDEPGAMLEPELVKALMASQRFDHVVGAPFTGQSTWRLDSTVLMLSQNTQANPVTFTLSLQVRLLRTRDQQVLMTQTFSETVPLSVNTPKAGVMAAHQALAQILQSLVLYLNQTYLRP